MEYMEKNLNQNATVDWTTLNPEVCFFIFFQELSLYQSCFNLFFCFNTYIFTLHHPCISGCVDGICAQKFEISSKIFHNFLFFFHFETTINSRECLLNFMKQ